MPASFRQIHRLQKGQDQVGWRTPFDVSQSGLRDRRFTLLDRSVLAGHMTVRTRVVFSDRPGRRAEFAPTSCSRSSKRTIGPRAQAAEIVLACH